MNKTKGKTNLGVQTLEDLKPARWKNLPADMKTRVSELEHLTGLNGEKLVDDAFLARRDLEPHRQMIIKRFIQLGFTPDEASKLSFTDLQIELLEGKIDQPTEDLQLPTRRKFVGI